MTPEQKAREIAKAFCVHPGCAVQDAIATGIRDARNEALEEAAKVASTTNVFLASSPADAIATNIRTLKDKGERE